MYHSNQDIHFSLTYENLWQVMNTINTWNIPIAREFNIKLTNTLKDLGMGSMDNCPGRQILEDKKFLNVICQ